MKQSSKMSMTPFVYEIFIKGKHLFVSNCLFIPFHLHSAIKLPGFPLGHSQHHFSWESLGLGNCLLSAESGGGFFLGSGWIRWIRAGGEGRGAAAGVMNVLVLPHPPSALFPGALEWRWLWGSLIWAPQSLHSKTWGSCQLCVVFFPGH